jgi:predicted dithiol-disulfide oxidoreductase (DUF899 family)
MAKPDLTNHKVVSPSEWLEARKNFLLQEREFTHLRKRLGRQRRELPWAKVEKDYVFDGPGGMICRRQRCRNYRGERFLQGRRWEHPSHLFYV